MGIRTYYIKLIYYI